MAIVIELVSPPIHPFPQTLLPVPNPQLPPSSLPLPNNPLLPIEARRWVFNGELLSEACITILVYRSVI